MPKTVSERLEKLVEGGSEMRFADLPQEAQLAMVHYMAVDGEAWDYEPLDGKLPDPSGQILIDALPYYTDKYGDWKFGYHPGIPTRTLITSVMNDNDINVDYDNWDAYHEWYQDTNHYDHDTTKPLWPVIRSCYNDETLQDGWHRFHCYVEKGVQLIPILWYV